MNFRVCTKEKENMNENVKIFFGLIGGLALFLYGMNSMSDALQKAAGEGMKKILSFLTRNAVMGALAGALVTAVLQSSSATTVMVIGFVSAGLMSLPQAISVIFGANIGTTMTAQLMAFKISNYIYPIIFIGFLLNFISKKEKSFAGTFAGRFPYALHDPRCRRTVKHCSGKGEG